VAENKLEMDIIGLYDSNLVNLFSINQIAAKLGKKYPYINKKVTSLLKENILKKTVVGRSHLCSLNMENEQTLLMLSMRQLVKKRKLKISEEINEFIEQNKLTITIHCVVKYNNSLLFVVENIKDRRRIVRRFSDAVVVGKQEFLDLLDEEERLFRGHIVLYGTERFYEFLMIELEELKRQYSPLRY